MALDELTGSSKWQRFDHSSRYDFASIRRRLDSLRHQRSRHDYHGLLFTLNEGIHGNMGGMGRSSLYEKSRFGTKQLIADYVEELNEAIELIARPELREITLEEKLEFFRRAQHCYGQSALMLSGAGMLFPFHLGVIKALLQQKLLPEVLSGSSGGASVAGMVGTHTDEELEQLLTPDRLAEIFESGGDTSGRLQKLRPQILSDREKRAVLERLVPDLTFAEAYRKTGRGINITVSPQEPHQTSRLLNATASPNVLVREAIMASTAVPGIYPAITLTAKDRNGDKKAYLPTRKWVDGAVTDDLPAKRLARLYGVNHFIVSQTNPFVIPFIRDDQRRGHVSTAVGAAAVQTARIWLNVGANIASKSVWKYPKAHMAMLTTLAIFDQDYLGDINILPPYKLYKPNRLFSRITADEISALMSMGERAAWPQIERIRIQSKIGMTLKRVREQYELPVIAGAKTE